MIWKQWLDLPNWYTASLNKQTLCWHQTHFSTNEQQNVCRQQIKLRCMILHDHWIIWAKILCSNACTKLQQSIWHPHFPQFHFDPQKEDVLILLDWCNMVGVGLWALRKGENELVTKKDTFSHWIYNWVRTDFGDQKRDAMSFLRWGWAPSAQSSIY